MNLLRKLVVKNLKLNKKRTIVTIVGIILSVALLSALSTLIMSFRQSIIEFEIAKGGNFHLLFEGVDDDFVDTIKKNRAVEHIYVTYGIGYARIEESQNANKPYAYILATDSFGFEQGGFRLTEGRAPQNENEIVIPSHLKTNGRVNYKIGDKITLKVGKRVVCEDGTLLDQNNPYDDTTPDYEMLVETTEKTYTVVGICDRSSAMVEPYSAPGYTFVTYSEAKPAGSLVTTAYARYTKKGLADYPRVTAKLLGVNEDMFASFFEGNITDQYSDEEVEEFWNAVYSKCRPNVNFYLIAYERLWPIDATFKVLVILGSIVAAIIIITSVYCIKNSFEISVTEKIRQYGMLAGIGATKKQISKSVHTEASIMGLIGIPVGVASGIFAAWVLVIVTNVLLVNLATVKLVFSFSLLAIIVSILLGAVTIYLSAASGAHKASKVSPIEAIRNQNEIKINSKKIKTPWYISKLWGIGGVISYKNIKRNRKKYRTTVVSITICTITFIIISYFMSLGKSFVGTQVSENEANIIVNNDIIVPSSTYLSDMEQFDKVEKMSIINSSSIGVYNKDCTKDYLLYFYGDLEIQSEYHFISIVALDQKSFEAYAAECGIKPIAGQAILINSSIDRNTGEITCFNVKKGEEFTFVTEEYVTDENGKGKIEVTESKIQLCGTTNKRPFGRQGRTTTELIVSEETLNAIYEEAGIQSIRQEAHFKTSDPDALQDSLEKFFEDNGAVYGMDVDINNRAQNARNEKTIFLLMGIFSYGLITVIALIGVTNIVNTLGTSMELRSREFATLRSIGMTSGQFKRMVRLESVFTSAKALFFGVTLGLAGSWGIWYLENTYDMSIPFNPPIDAVIISIAVVFVLVYAIISTSLTKINRKNIIETIKNENL